MTFETPEQSPETHELGREIFRRTREYQTTADTKILDDIEDDVVAELAVAYAGYGDMYGNREDGPAYEAGITAREIATNAMFHGNLGVRKEKDTDDLVDLGRKALAANPSLADKKVIRELVAREGGFDITFTDEGAGFTEPGVTVAEDDLLKTNGRGWIMANFYQFHPEVINTGHGSMVRLRRNFSDKPRD